jgi:hypothetical protein
MVQGKHINLFLMSHGNFQSHLVSKALMWNAVSKGTMGAPKCLTFPVSSGSSEVDTLHHRKKVRWREEGRCEERSQLLEKLLLKNWVFEGVLTCLPIITIKKKVGPGIIVHIYNPSYLGSGGLLSMASLAEVWDPIWKQTKVKKDWGCGSSSNSRSTRKEINVTSWKWRNNRCPIFRWLDWINWDAGCHTGERAHLLWWPRPALGPQKNTEASHSLCSLPIGWGSPRPSCFFFEPSVN